MWNRVLSFCPLFTLFCSAYAASYSNPLKYYNGGDPDLVYHDGHYYLMTTTLTDLQMTRSSTLDGLKTGENRTVYTDSNPSRCCEVWAPEMHLIGLDWYIFYTASSATEDTHRMHVLKGGATPWDAFNYLDQVNTPDWAIDGTTLSVNNAQYFVYSCRRNDTGTQLQSLCIASMSSPTSIGSEHLLSQPTAGWETVGLPVNEGPYALYHGGRTWLTFSASFCGTDSYAVGLLTYNGGDPLDMSSWSKSSGPVFSGTSGVESTGHNTFFKSPDGSQTWMTYHSYPPTNGDCSSNRYTNSKAITFNSDGTPNFGQPVAFSQTLPAPSGE